MDFYLSRASENKASVTLPITWEAIREEYCLENYYLAMQPPKGLSPEGVISNELWEEILASVKLSASPGVDLCYEYQTNGSFLEDGGVNLRKLVQARIFDRLRFFDEACESEPSKADAFTLVESGLQDPIRIFGKGDPTGIHKETRMINSVSIVDSCVERALTLRKAQYFTDRWMEGQSAVGIQLKDIDALREFRFRAEKYLGNKVSNDDMQGYEYSFKEDCMDIAYDIECYLNQAKFDKDVTYEFDVYAKLLFVENWLAKAPSVIVCSDGVVLETSECWLRSGRFKTSFYGTHVRSALCTIAASAANFGSYTFVPAKSNGDDCLSKWIEGLDYKELGFVVTDSKVSEDDMPWSYCSHLILRDTHYPESITKTVLNLLRNRKVTPELYDAFVFTNRDRPDWSQVDETVRAIIQEAEDLLNDHNLE